MIDKKEQVKMKNPLEEENQLLKNQVNQLLIENSELALKEDRIFRTVLIQTLREQTETLKALAIIIQRKVSSPDSEKNNQDEKKSTSEPEIRTIKKPKFIDDENEIEDEDDDEDEDLEEEDDEDEEENEDDDDGDSEEEEELKKYVPKKKIKDILPKGRPKKFIDD